MSTALQLQDVHSSYDKREVIRGVSLSVRHGESVAMVGPNGAGKSTVLKMIAGLANLDGGKILLHEHDIGWLPSYERSRLGLGYLMQGGRTFPSLSVGENLAMGTLVLPKSQRRQALREVAELFELTGELKKLAGILSGGQRQRLSMGMVLAGRPSVLLLDEPSSGVSPTVVKSAFRALTEYQQLHNAAILLVEQQLSAVIDFADRALVLVDGRIKAETDNLQQLLSRSVVDSLFWSRNEDVIVS